MSAASKVHIRHYAALDGFRGVLALMVAVYHTLWLSHLNSTPLFNNGQVLVDLFFVFSGFLMFTLYNGRLNTGAQGADFIKKRFARIYPLHFFMLMVFVLFAFARIVSHKVGISVVEPGEILPFQEGAAESLSSFLSNLTLTQAMGVHDSLTYNPPAWTVSVEFWAYFVFLAMMLIAPPTRARHFGIIAVGVAVLYFFLSTLKPNMDITYDYAFWRCLGGFFSGVLTAWLVLNKDKIIPSRIQSSSVVMTASELLTLLILGGFVIYFTGKLQFLLAPVAILFVFVFALDKGSISKLMTTHPAQYLGKISYSIYLTHVIISIVFNVFAERIMPGIAGPGWNESGWGGDMLLLPYLAVVILCSHWTYHKIEMPGRKAILAYDFTGKWKILKRRVTPSSAS